MKLVPKLLTVFLITTIIILGIEIIAVLDLIQIEKYTNDIQTNIETLQKTTELNNLAVDIKYYDEVLTQSVRNYAFTHDIKWKERYQVTEPNLDRIIKRSIMIGDQTDKDFFVNIDVANLALIKMEYDSIELIDQDHSDKAIKILESKQYWDLKKNYSDGLDRYVTKHNKQQGNVLSEHDQSIIVLGTKIKLLESATTNMLMISIPILLTSSVIFLIILSKHVLKPINVLVKFVKEIASGHFGNKIKINNDDEINVLAKAFNLMSKQLEGYMQKTEIDRLKDEFMAMISHELKTPLVPISSYVGLLLAGKYGELTNIQREKILIIQTSTELLLKLVFNLLDAQKIELGKLRLDIKNENISKIILDVIKKIEPITSKSGINITTDLQNNLQCFCDKDRIEQTIAEILLNSIDFCPKDTGKIHIMTKIENNFVNIVIKDNGVGMTKEKIENMFTKFYQSDTRMIREHGGIGLGLAVCKGIVENHGGKIWVESEGVGKGMEVHILLPQKIMNKVLN